MSTSTEQVKFAPAKAIPSNRTSIFRRIIDHRNDYLYVAPALLVMMFVIAYPIYYTIELSFFRTPANLQMKDKVFVGLDNYVTILSSSAVHQVTVNTLIWTFFRRFWHLRSGYAPRFHFTASLLVAAFCELFSWFPM